MLLWLGISLAAAIVALLFALLLNRRRQTQA
jgi:hypothetical protein